MAIYAVYIVNKAGTLIYQYDHKSQNISNEKTFSYPLELTLKVFDQKVVVDFGQCDGVKVGHTVLSINGIPAEGQYLEDGREIIQVIEDQSLYPLSIKFGRPSPRPNEKIMLASMFHSFYAIACQLSPVAHSSGIKLLETDTFKLHCTQTLTGLKFVVLTDPAAPSQDALLRKLYEVYSDYALKNPFYILDMPIKCDLFNVNLQAAIEQAERTNAAV